MSANEAGFTVQGQVHINRLNPDTGTVEPGWEVTVRDSQTGVVIPVFVADAVYGPEQAKQLIDHALAQVRSVHGLGS